MVWRVLCFGDDFPFPSPTVAGNAAKRDCTVGALEQRAVVERELPAAAAGDGVDGRLVFCVDGGDGDAAPAGGPAAVQQVCVHRQCTVYRIPVSINYGFGQIRILPVQDTDTN